MVVRWMTACGLEPLHPRCTAILGSTHHWRDVMRTFQSQTRGPLDAPAHNQQCTGTAHSGAMLARVCCAMAHKPFGQLAHQKTNTNKSFVGRPYASTHACLKILTLTWFQ